MTETAEITNVKTKKRDHSIMMDNYIESLVNNTKQSGESFSAAVCRMIEIAYKSLHTEPDLLNQMNSKIDLILKNQGVERQIESNATIQQRSEEDELLDLLREPMNEYQIASFLNIDAVKARQLINKMLGLTKIKKTGRNQYVRK